MHIELDFISSRYSLYHLEHFFCYLMEGVNISPSLKHKIRLCFTEAVTNAVVHGNQYNDSKKVWISLLNNHETISFQIKDEGCGFDMKRLLNPLDEINLHKPNGRGVFLIKELSDYCSYELSDNCLKMEFKIVES